MVGIREGEGTVAGLQDGKQRTVTGFGSLSRLDGFAEIRVHVSLFAIERSFLEWSRNAIVDNVQF